MELKEEANVWEKADKVLSLLIRLLERELGDAKPQLVTPLEAPTPMRTRAPKPKQAPIPPAPEPEADPFAIGGGEEAAVLEASAEPSIEETQEARLRCRELVSAFVQKRAKSTPSGLEQAKAITIKAIGSMKKIEEMTYKEHATLIRVFEAAEKKA